MNMNCLCQVNQVRNSLNNPTKSKFKQEHMNRQRKSSIQLHTESNLLNSATKKDEDEVVFISKRNGQNQV